MKHFDVFVAWLEDDDTLREEIRKQTRRELPGVPIHFSGTVAGFWECLCQFSPQILMVDVMLPKIAGVKRLSEGVAVAQWIQKREITESAAASLGIPKEMCKLRGDYSRARLYFVTGRGKAALRAELRKAKVNCTKIIEKGLSDDKSVADKAIKIIEEAWRDAGKK